MRFVFQACGLWFIKAELERMQTFFHCGTFGQQETWHLKLESTVEWNGNEHLLFEISLYLYQVYLSRDYGFGKSQTANF